VSSPAEFVGTNATRLGQLALRPSKAWKFDQNRDEATEVTGSVRPSSLMMSSPADSSARSRMIQSPIYFAYFAWFFLGVLLLAITGTAQADDISTIDPSLEPLGMTLEGNNLWISGYGSGIVTAVNEKTYRVEGSFRAGLDASAAAFSPDGKTIFIANEYGSSITAYDARAFTREYTINFHAGSIARVKTDENGLGYFLSGRPDRVNIFDDATGSIVGHISTDGVPRGLAFNKPQTLMAVGIENIGEIEVVNVATRKIVRTIQTGERPRDVSINGRYVYSANFGSNSVTKANIYTGGVVANIPVGSGPRRIVSFDKKEFVSNALSSSVSVIRGDTVIGTIHTNAKPVGLAVLDQGRKLAVSTRSNGAVEVYSLGKTAPKSAATSAPAAAIAHHGANVGFDLTDLLLFEAKF
jgi:YVTN family beta-propeller protein